MLMLTLTWCAGILKPTSGFARVMERDLVPPKCKGKEGAALKRCTVSYLKGRMIEVSKPRGLQAKNQRGVVPTLNALSAAGSRHSFIDKQNKNAHDRQVNASVTGAAVDMRYLYTKGELNTAAHNALQGMKDREIVGLAADLIFENPPEGARGARQFLNEKLS